MSSVAVAASKPSVVYASGGKDVFRSADAGRRWVDAGSPGASIRMLAVSPTDPDVLLGVAEHLVFETMDGGSTWRALHAGWAPDDVVRTLLIDPADPQTLVVATSDEGVFRSVDGGRTWKSRSQGLPPNRIGTIAMDPNDPTRFLRLRVNAGRGVARVVIRWDP